MVINLKKSIFIFIFISSSLFSQEMSNLDPEFINSLEDAVQDQVSGNNSEDDELDFLLNSKTSVKKNLEILRLLKKQVDELESSMLGEGKSAETEFARFGNSFFSSIQSTFMPINIPNLSDDYILDYGDKLNIQVVGSNSNLYKDLIIERDGSVLIPNYGRLVIAGKTFQDSTLATQAFIQSKSFGDEVYVTLSEIRDIQIIVIGGVESPGIYTVSGSSNVLGVLNAAGGISASGSFRDISLIRNNELFKTIDLYELLIFGKNFFDINLKSGDVLRVNPINFNVGISGAINNQAIFDIKTGETLADLLRFAGGISQNHEYQSSIILERNDGSKFTRLEISDPSNVVLKPKDSVIVPSYEKELSAARKVSINGFVNLPGEYNIRDGEKLSELIRRAGGYKSNAYPYGSLLFRQEIKLRSEQYDKRIYTDTINYLVSNLGTSTSSQTLTGDFIKVLIEEFKSQQPIERIVTEFDLNAIKNNPALDLLLADGDRIFIPQLPQEVYLFGEYNEPLVVRYSPELSLNEYIAMAAGESDSATAHAIVIDPNGRATYIKRKNFNIFTKQIPIYPGSVIYLPREIGRVEGVQYAAMVAPIFSSLALSLASISAIDNN